MSNSTATVDRLRRSGAVLSQYVRRLLSPPMPGDGLLLVAFLAGVVGWGLSWLFARNPALAPLGPIRSIVAAWAVLTAGTILLAVAYAAPTVGRTRVWLVWAGLSVAATAVNLAALAELLPPGVALYGYWHPWFAVIGVGYLVTGLDDWGNPQLRRRERLVYAASGVATLGLLAAGIGPLSRVVLANLFVLGGAVQLVPIGFDVLADAVRIARRR